MVLITGGPCIAVKKMKDAEGNPTTGVCNKTEAHVWYAGSTKCKGCYESASRIGKRKMETALGHAVALDLEDLQEESQEILVEIEEIYAVRCDRARTRDRSPSQQVPPPPSIKCHPAFRP
jgi:hypothetical protein